MKEMGIATYSCNIQLVVGSTTKSIEIIFEKTIDFSFIIWYNKYVRNREQTLKNRKGIKI